MPTFPDPELLPEEDEPELCPECGVEMEEGECKRCKVIYIEGSSIESDFGPI